MIPTCSKKLSDSFANIRFYECNEAETFSFTIIYECNEAETFSFIIIYECNEAENLVLARETIYDITDCDIF